MHAHGIRIISAGVLGLSFSVALASAARAQIGHVVDAQKISDTAGGFTALLDEEDQFGRSIVNLGDMDGDGVSDILVGAHTDDDGGVDKGSAYVLFLHPNGYVKAWTKISDTSGNFAENLDPGDQFGRAAASLGDLDLDGVVDVAVSANYDDDGGANRGAVYVLFLNADGTVKARQKISQGTGGLPVLLKNHDEFGRSITNLGDMDGDGIPDIVVGTPEDDDGGTNTGALHVLFLNRDGTVKTYRRISRSSSGLLLKPGDWFGFCSTNLGDFDGDGVTDLAVGSVLDDDGGFNQGSIWLLFLNADGSVKEAHEINELVGGFTATLDDIDQFGTSLANIGDLDGDGVVDLVVGAVKDDDGGQPGNVDADVGAAYVLFLRADATVKSWVKIGDLSGDMPYDLDQYDWFGSAVARLGGASGDGLFNLAIGCRNDDDGSPNRGAVYLVQLNDGSAPVADFVASKTLGVAPMTVQFSDQSLNEVDAWLWNFSEGNQSNLQNPTHTFANPGTYDVTLSVRGPRGSDLEKRLGFITVVAGPLAEFSATPTSGVAPLGVQFTDLSEGTVSSWSWDFGDGAFSSAPSPFHVFAAGTHTVSLTVTGPNGIHTSTRTDLIVAEDLVPRADFAPTPETGFAPLAVQFQDLSTGLVTGWTWDFGDGALSNETDPLHTFALPGTYDVSLTASGPYGTETRTQLACVVVESPVPAAAFGAAPPSGFAPLGVQFEDLSSGNVTSWSWDFGDGAGSSDSAPIHVYRDSGTYAVTLTVAGPSGTDSLSQVGLITVSEPPPAAEFNATSTIGAAPLAVQFTDTSSGNLTSWWWEFGDGTTSVERDPEHVYAAPGSYDVRLTVTGPAGSDVEFRAAWVTAVALPPEAAFSGTPVTGTAPLAVQFADLSTGTVSAWAWSFGDGASSGEASPLHTYTTPGTYDVSLTVTGPAGSDVELVLGYVTVQWPAPVPEFVFGPVAGFAPLPISFTDLSTGNITSWSWTFGDGGTSRQRFPVRNYTRTGTFTATLTVQGPGGTASVSHGGITILAVPSLVDGGFELSTVGAAPGAPWSVVLGSAIVVQSNAAPDTGFPREGASWCEIGAEGSVAATPPGSPGGAGAPSTGVAAIERSFAYSSLAPHLLFDAAFLLGDAEDSASTNDFMSVELSDGSSHVNVFYADSFSEFPALSSKYGLPMTAAERVHVDLRALFPGLSEGATLVLRIGVGNGGDELDASKGYVDSFRFVPSATASFRNGTGRNAPRYVSSPAVLGGTWTVQVDLTGRLGSTAIQLVGMQRPASGTLKAAGEVLIAGRKTFAQSWPALPGLNVRTVSLPVDLALLGQFMATQVTVVGGGSELTNAYDLGLGF